MSHEFLLELEVCVVPKCQSPGLATGADLTVLAWGLLGAIDHAGPLLSTLRRLEAWLLMKPLGVYHYPRGCNWATTPSY